MVARYEAWAAATGDTFRIVGSADKAFEIAVLRAAVHVLAERATPADADAIPGPGRDDRRAVHVAGRHRAGLPLYADTGARALHPVLLPDWAPQLGYWRAPHRPPGGPFCATPALRGRAISSPATSRMRFDTTAMPDIDRWVRRHGDRLIFVNGAQDPAVAEPFRPGGRDARTLWAPDTRHHVTFDALTAADRAYAVAILNRWAGNPIPRGMDR